MGAVTYVSQSVESWLLAIRAAISCMWVKAAWNVLMLSGVQLESMEPVSVEVSAPFGPGIVGTVANADEASVRMAEITGLLFWVVR